MSMIQIQNLTFAYPGGVENIFENVSVCLDTDWKLALIGRNGRGKTTLLRLLLGELSHAGGISASVDFAYFPFPVGDGGRNTLDVVSDLCPGLEQWRLNREYSLLGLGEEVLGRPFDSLSGGERVKALLGALFLKDNAFLLIDEPTDHLDLEGRRLVAEYLNRKKGFILVSHDRRFLDGCVDHVLSINRADIELQRGNFSSWQRNREAQDSFELGENEKLKKEVKRLGEAAKRAERWSDKAEKGKYGVPSDQAAAVDRGYVGHKAAKMMKRAKSVDARKQKAIEEKSALLKNRETAEPLKLRPLTHYAKTLVELDGLEIRYGEREVLREFSLRIEGGERIALFGRNGSGKSSLIKLIAGLDIPHAGRVSLAPGLRLSYVPQDTAHLRGGLREYAREYGIDESLFKAILRKLDFSRPQLETNMESYSQGQKKKVLIARSLCEEAHLYLWDEPLNYIDVLSRMQIEELLLSHQPTILFVEHDLAFVETVSTRMVRL